MFVYDNINIRGYKGKAHTASSNIKEASVAEVASLSSVVPPFKEIKTPNKRKLTSENSEFIESLGFKVKKQNAEN